MDSTIFKVRRQNNKKRRKEGHWHCYINPTPIPTRKGWCDADIDEAILFIIERRCILHLKGMHASYMLVSTLHASIIFF